MKQIATLGRAGGAVAALLVIVVVLASGLWFAKEASDAALLERDAKTTSLEALTKRMQLPPRAPADNGEANEFLEGANYALAANGMQRRIVELIESSGGTLVTVGIDPPDEVRNATLRRVVVQAVSELTNDGLQQVLYRLESGRPSMLVETLSVRNAPKHGEGEGAGRDRTVRLAVDLRVYGYFRGGGQ